MVDEDESPIVCSRYPDDLPSKEAMRQREQSSFSTTQKALPFITPERAVGSSLREGDTVSCEVGQDRTTGKAKAEHVSVL